MKRYMHRNTLLLIAMLLFVSLFTGCNQDSTEDLMKNSYSDGIVIYLAIFISVFTIVSIFIRKKSLSLSKKKEYIILGSLLTLGFVVKIIVGYYSQGYINDILCFKSWALSSSKKLSSVYSSGFCDYPPVYIYVLSILGEFGHVVSDKVFSIIIRIPAILSDLGISVILFNLAKKRFDSIKSILVAVFIIFNPALIMNSSVWGMMDSFLVLLILGSLISLMKKRFSLSMVFLTLAILTKPQGLFFAPIFGAALLAQWKKGFFKYLWQSLLAMLATIFIVILPFLGAKGPLWIFDLYSNTASTYPYITLNAFNFYALFGLNNAMTDDALIGLISYQTFSLILLSLSTLFTMFIIIWSKKPEIAFFSSALINMEAFMLLTRMHERYIFPVVILLAFAYIFSKDIKTLICALISTISITLNMHITLSYYLNDGTSLVSYNSPGLIVTSVTNVILFSLMIWIGFENIKKKKSR